MIDGAHVIRYTSDAEANRRFIRDELGFPGVDAGHGRSIFNLLLAQIAAHPTEGPESTSSI